MEYRKDKRFVVYWTMLSSTIYERDRGWANLWEEICAAVGEDPATTERVEVPDSFKIAMGASPTPPAPLPELIAVYVLAGEPLEPLLEKLCLWPEDMDNAKLLEVVNKLKLYAAQLARLVRGGEVKQGPPAEGLSGTQLWAARHIQKWREQGMTDGDILELLHEHGREFGSDLANLTREDVSRLGDLRPPAPHAIYVSHSCLI
jgi:hypothetical protein